MSTATAQAPPIASAEAESTLSAPPASPPGVTPIPSAPPLLDGAALKSLIKEAIAEVFHEQRMLIAECVVQAIEDMALVRLIDEGMESEEIPIEEVYRTLDALPCES